MMKGIAYLLQSTLILLWWIGLLVSDRFFEAFQFPEIGTKAFQSFLAPDIIIIAGLSLFRAYRESKPSEYIILGGFGYASLFYINATLLTGGGYLATTVMTLGLCYNLFLVFQDKSFRESASSNIWVNGAKTFVQIICVWLIILVILPYLIIHEFDIFPVDTYLNSMISYILFILFSSLGLYSSYIMVTLGDGTPLPIDQTKKLVVEGTYRYVRNPMAIAGIGQGISIRIYSLTHFRSSRRSCMAPGR